MAKIRGKLKLVDIDQVYPNDYNHNEMSEDMMEKEAEAFKRFGVIRSVLTRETAKDTYSIIDGEHRWKILKKAGATKIQIRDLGPISETEAKTLTIALDEIRGTPDFIKSAELFASIKSYKLEEIATFLPYKESELEVMIDAVDFDFSEYGNPEDPFKDSMVTEYATISCRVPKDEAAELDSSIEALSTRLGLSDKKEHIQAGNLFQHLLKETVANS